MAFDFKDFYLKYPGHPKFNDIEIIEDEILRIIVQKMEMILLTQKGELLGDPDFGADLITLLHQTKVSARYVKERISNQFNRYIKELDSNNISYTLDVQFGKHPTEYSDIMYVNVTLRELSARFLIGLNEQEEDFFSPFTNFNRGGGTTLQ